MFGGIIFLSDNINAIIWLYNNINIIIWPYDNILLFDQTYDWAGLYWMYVQSDYHLAG
jgi:hypothetical protein